MKGPQLRSGLQGGTGMETKSLGGAQVSFVKSRVHKQPKGAEYLKTEW